MIDTRIKDWLDRNAPRLHQQWFEFLAIPSVSTDPAFADGIGQASAFLRAHTENIGLRNASLLEAGGHPAVYADWLDAGDAPTVLLYGHYDVQPPDPVELWDSPPFVPTLRDGRVYCRGASDDKSPVWTMLTAVEAVLATEGRLPVNVRLLIEGEEEIGSRTLPELLARHRDLLSSDVLISADGSRWRPDLSSVNVNSRGLCAMELCLRTADSDLHSGRYGGAVANAVAVLARLLATLHDESGQIAVAGFYDGLRGPGNAELAALHAVPFDESVFFAEIGARPGAAERGRSTLEAMWLRPTLEVNGFWGGYTGPGTKTVLPHQARAKITCRLGLGQAPEAVAESVATHLRAYCPPYATLEVTRERGGTRAYAIPADDPTLSIVESVMEEAGGRRPVRVGVGGTLPISSLVKEQLGMETVMVSYAVSDENIHAPNEFFRIASLEEGLRAWVLLLPALAAGRRGDQGPRAE